MTTLHILLIVFLSRATSAWALTPGVKHPNIAQNVDDTQCFWENISFRNKHRFNYGNVEKRCCSVWPIHDASSHFFFIPVILIPNRECVRSCELDQKKKNHPIQMHIVCSTNWSVCGCAACSASTISLHTKFWVWTQNWELKISIIMPELWSSSTLHTQRTQQTHQLQITQLEKKECWKQRRSMSDVDFNSDLMICVCLCLLSSKNTRVSDTVHYTAPKVGTSHCLTSHNFEFRVLNES